MKEGLRCCMDNVYSRNHAKGPAVALALSLYWEFMDQAFLGVIAIFTKGLRFCHIYVLQCWRNVGHHRGVTHFVVVVPKHFPGGIPIHTPPLTALQMFCMFMKCLDHDFVVLCICKKSLQSCNQEFAVQTWPSCWVSCASEHSHLWNIENGGSCNTRDFDYFLSCCLPGKTVLCEWF